MSEDSHPLSGEPHPLDAVERHPEYPALLRETPGVLRYYVGFSVIALFGLLFAGGSVVMGAAVPSMDHAPDGLFHGFLLLFAAVGVGIFGFGLVRAVNLAASSLQCSPALLVDKRLSVRGGGGSSGASTRYYVTLEFRDGQRRELESRGSLYGQVTKDDVGVAYFRERYLLDFRRVTVT